ncbi:MAG: SUMF1/EgtB/PvdO family nonheme iron enzyme, partial [Roseibacillus sp.]|nr:SUMF1/EgtB/PvdO family nonheme iron enzyme [Roseibacillus sp.]
MRNSLALFLGFALLLLPAGLRAADPVVSNVSAAQRAGTRLVDIRYDVTADTPTVVIFLEISSDGGATFDVPVGAVSGDIGADIAVGTGKTVTWNAGINWDQQVSSQTRFRVIADDGVPTTPDPSIFAAVAAGALPEDSWAGGFLQIGGSPKWVDAFYMGKTEVTWDRWQEVRSWAASNGYDIGGVGAGVSANLITTYLFRNTFEITAEQLGEAEWLIDYLIDDGAVVYINETEIFRTPSMPAGAVETTTLAAVALGRNEATFSKGNLSLSGILVEGANSIAVEVHQASLTSSDVGFQLQLTPASQNPTDRDPLITGAWDYLDRIENENGTNLGYPVDGSGNAWNSAAFDVATSTIGPWESEDAPIQTGGIDGFPGAPDLLFAPSIGNHPVTNVTWYQALKWCNAASEREGLDPVYKVGAAVYRTGDLEPSADESANGYRLPSEMEWEFAARGGVATNGYQYSGSNNVDEVGWYGDNSGGAVHAVATKQPNELGLWDMSGNVMEWCFDDWGQNRVVRGGSWHNSPNICQVAHRANGDPTDEGDRAGFRVARGPTPAFAVVAAGALPNDSWAGAQSVDAFYMGTTEVTWNRWQEVRSWAAANGYDIGGVGVGAGENYPVTNVTWYQALKWCNAASEMEGLNPVYKVRGEVYRSRNRTVVVDESAHGYRLPSEKEWEFAARGGVATNGYEYSGSDNVNEVAWYSGNSDSAMEVATKQPNELGLSDMSGNVWEWCFDMYQGFSNRMIGGGAWNYEARGCRVARHPNRWHSDLLRQTPHHGFRVARGLHGPGSATTGDVLVDARAWTLSPGVTANGSITGGGTYPSGTSATLAAIPDLGYFFTGWNGDASGTDNPLSLTMDENQTVGALFAQDIRDPDQDGLSNYRELIVHGTDPDNADSDGDGFNDGLEISESTNPNGAQDYPTRVLTVSNTANGTITGGGIYRLGTGAVLTAVPALGYVFTAWTGDVANLTNPLAIVMDENQTAGAVFSQNQRDPDGDGLSNYQELVLHGTDPNDADSDGDGFNDGLEISESTNPNDGQDFPNQAPEFADQEFELLRFSPGGSVVGVLAATDPNGDALSYSMVENPDPNGNGSSAFRVVGNQLLVNDSGDVSLSLRTVPIAASYRITLVLRENGTVAAWGRNNHGQATIPEALDRVVAVSAGVGHSLALQEDGTVVAWGRDHVGQRTVPNDLNDAIAISAGENHSLAVRADGTVIAWGDNGSGQSNVPAGLTGVRTVAAGRYHSLALREDGTVVAWGSNSRNQSEVPQGLRGIIAIAAGEEHSLALWDNGTVTAWGRNNRGQTSVPNGLNEVVAIAAGRTHNLALKEDGTVVEWGVPNGLNQVVPIAAGLRSVT